MNTAVMDFAHTEPPMGEPDWSIRERATQKKFFWMKLMIAVLAIGTIVAIILYSQMGNTMERIGELESQNATLERKNSALAAQVKSLPDLKKELADSKRVSAAKTAEVNRLAVLLTRSEAGRKQAMADHEAALRQIAALEKAGAGKKAPPRRK